MIIDQSQQSEKWDRFILLWIEKHTDKTVTRVTQVHSANFKKSIAKEINKIPWTVSFHSYLLIFFTFRFILFFSCSICLTLIIKIVFWYKNQSLSSWHLDVLQCKSNLEWKLHGMEYFCSSSMIETIYLA